VLLLSGSTTVPTFTGRDFPRLVWQRQFAFGRDRLASPCWWWLRRGDLDGGGANWTSAGHARGMQQGRQLGPERAYDQGVV
jgi:hypothetical protein